VPSKEQSEEINEGLRSSLASAIGLAKAISSEEGVVTLQEGLNRYAKGIGTFINLHVPFDQDVLVAYAELRKLATELNEDNKVGNDGKDILTIPLPYTVHPDTQAITTFPFPEPSALATKNISHSNGIASSPVSNAGDEKLVISLTNNTQTEINPSIKPTATPTPPIGIKNRNQPMTR
jgi:hypothetical protein